MTPITVSQSVVDQKLLQFREEIHQGQEEMEHINQTLPINQSKTCILSSVPLLSNLSLVFCCCKCMGLTASFILQYLHTPYSFGVMSVREKKKEKMKKLKIFVFGFVHFEKVRGT